MKKSVLWISLLAMMLTMSACGGKKEAEPVASTASAETTAAAVAEETTEAATTVAETEATTEAPKEESYEAVYDIYAIESSGMIISAADADMAGQSSVDLKAGGSGEMKMGDEVGTIDNWTVTAGTISITIEGDTAEGTIGGGIIRLELAEDVIAYYVTADADTSSIECVSLEEFLNAGEEEESEEATEEETAVEKSDDDDDAGYALASKAGVFTDDEHFVLEMAGVLIAYDCDGDKVTGCTGYYDLGSEELAKLTAESYTEQENVDSVICEGTMIVITYSDSAFSSLTRSSLEMVYGDQKIEKK